MADDVVVNDHCGASSYKLIVDPETRKQLLLMRRKMRQILASAREALAEVEELLDTPLDKRTSR